VIITKTRVEKNDAESGSGAKDETSNFSEKRVEIKKTIKEGGEGVRDHKTQSRKVNVP
jgi:hypothetical protein